MNVYQQFKALQQAAVQKPAAKLKKRDQQFKALQQAAVQKPAAKLKRRDQQFKALQQAAVQKPAAKLKKRDQQFKELENTKPERVQASKRMMIQVNLMKNKTLPNNKTKSTIYLTLSSLGKKICAPPLLKSLIQM
jgi:hypothetical protein